MHQISIYCPVTLNFTFNKIKVLNKNEYSESFKGSEILTCDERKFEIYHLKNLDKQIKFKLLFGLTLYVISLD